MKKRFDKQYWTSSGFVHVYGVESLPVNMPGPRGIGFNIRAKVDANHATDIVTSRYRTGFLVYINCALVHWFSNKQACVDSISFGSDFVAMKHCCE